jgi:hypothetical protein
VIAATEQALRQKYLRAEIVRRDTPFQGNLVTTLRCLFVDFNSFFAPDNPCLRGRFDPG